MNPITEFLRQLSILAMKVFLPGHMYNIKRQLFNHIQANRFEQAKQLMKDYNLKPTDAVGGENLRTSMQIASGVLNVSAGLRDQIAQDLRQGDYLAYAKYKFMRENGASASDMLYASYENMLTSTTLREDRGIEAIEAELNHTNRTKLTWMAAKQVPPIDREALKEFTPLYNMTESAQFFKSYKANPNKRRAESHTDNDEPRSKRRKR